MTVTAAQNVSKAQLKFQRAVNSLLEARTYPSPTQILKALGRSGDNLNGKECQWRDAVMEHYCAHAEVDDFIRSRWLSTGVGRKWVPPFPSEDEIATAREELLAIIQSP